MTFDLDPSKDMFEGQGCRSKVKVKIIAINFIFVLPAPLLGKICIKYGSLAEDRTKLSFAAFLCMGNSTMNYFLESIVHICR